MPGPTACRQYVVERAPAQRNPQHDWHVARTNFLLRAASRRMSGMTQEDLADVDLVIDWLQTLPGTAERAWASEESLKEARGCAAV